MTTSATEDRLTLHQMSQAEALQKLATHTFGRLAVNVDDCPTIVPVNYAFVEPNIVIRTAPGSKLQWAPMTDVAFEIDDIDPDRTWGWSVVARGIAFDRTDALDEHSEMLRSLPFNPWLTGERHSVVTIKVRTVTGRRFGDTKGTQS